MPDGGYDAGYASGTCFWGREPGSFVRRMGHLLPSVEGLSVLDAGCGEGKNAYFLAASGAKVTAVDCSEIALSHARKMWPPNGIDWVQADIRKLTWGASQFDLVIAYGVFHCLADASEIANVIRALREATRPGGYHVLCAFNSRLQELTAHPNFNPCLVHHGYYVDLYKAWTIVALSDQDLTETHPHNMIRHTHSMTRMIVQRPHETDLSS